MPPLTDTATTTRPTHNRFGLPHLGFGLGLRPDHYDTILTTHPAVDWFEIISENFMNTGGRPMYLLDQFAERFPMVCHGVSMSIGTTDPVDFEYLGRLKTLANRIRACWVSDHLCWCGIAHRNLHDLLPLPYTEEALKHVVARIKIVQDFLERPLLLENPSSYVEFTCSTMTEWEFIRRMAEEADCGLLLDVNNVFVSASNHGFSADEYLKAIPHDRVVQYHLAGHTDFGTHRLDTHSDHVLDEVWRLYEQSYKLGGGAATMVEWDDAIPPFADVHREVLKARQHVEPLA